MNNRVEQRTDLRSWLDMVERLRKAPDWAAEDLPVEMIQTHISVVLLGKHRALKLKKPESCPAKTEACLLALEQ